jgi:hypothetical protein
MLPTVGGSREQVMLKLSVVVAPAVMITSFDAPPSTVQFAATSESTTEWLPAEMLATVALEFGPMG